MQTTYLITGTNRGIGFELSKRVVSNGDRLIAICRKPEEAIKLGELLIEYNDHMTIYAADVSNDIDLLDVASQIDCPIDTIICNAGMMSDQGGIVSRANESNIVSNILMTNIAGPFYTVRSFLPQLKLGKNPRIAIISSQMGSQKHQGASSYFYRASKAGVNNIMVTLSNELKSAGIIVNTFHPGWVRTDMGGKNANISPEESAENILKQLRKLNLTDTGLFLNYNGTELPL
jgi:NAD(P)-dependent dehydrogenase (short-subunit alcohol dehydrogenase family)